MRDRNINTIEWLQQAKYFCFIEPKSTKYKMKNNIGLVYREFRYSDFDLDYDMLVKRQHSFKQIWNWSNTGGGIMVVCYTIV